MALVTNLRYWILIFAFFVMSFYSCAQKKTENKENPTAVYYNNRALALSYKYFKISDSVQKAITLIDSAILIEPEYLPFYLNKWTIQYRAGLFDSAMNTCNIALTIDSINWMITLDKAITFERMRSNDSAIVFYEQSIRLLNKVTPSKPENACFIDYQKLIILKLLNSNNENIQKSIEDFSNKYKDVSEIDKYVNNLRLFNKQDYLQNL